MTTTQRKRKPRTTYYRTRNLIALAEAMIAELNHVEFMVPPVPLLYDLDTAGMLCGMSRSQLRDYLAKRSGEFHYKRNKYTRQCFLDGEDIKKIRGEVIEHEVIDYDPRAKNLPCVQKRLADDGFETSGSDGEGTSGHGEGSVR